MRKILEWLLLALLTVSTLFDGLLQYGSQFGADFTGSAGVSNLQFGWLIFVCKLLTLGASRISGVPMIVVGLLGWIYGVFEIRVAQQHQPLGTAVSNSFLELIYLSLAVLYTVISKRWSLRR